MASLLILKYRFQDSTIGTSLLFQTQFNYHHFDTAKLRSQHHTTLIPFLPGSSKKITEMIYLVSDLIDLKVIWLLCLPFPRQI